MDNVIKIFLNSPTLIPPLNSGQYGAWSYRQPDGENEACAVLDTAGNDRKFADESCFTKYPYICDISECLLRMIPSIPFLETFIGVGQ